MAVHEDRVQALMVGVGAAFDYEAGNIRRAPMDAAAQSGMALPPYAGPEAAVQAVFCDEHQIFVVDLETVKAVL